VVAKFLTKPPKLGKIPYVEVDPASEFSLPKLFRESVDIGIFEAESESLDRKVIVKVGPLSSFRNEINFSVYASQIGDFTALPHFVRILEVVKDDAPKFLARNLPMMKKALEKARQDSKNAMGDRLKKLQERIGQMAPQLRRTEVLAKHFTSSEYGYLVMEKLGPSISERYSPLIASMIPADAKKLFVYLFFQIVVILITFEDFNIQHNDLNDHNILTWDVDKEVKEVVYVFESTHGNTLRFTIPLDEVDHALLKVIDYEVAEELQDKCKDPREVVSFGLSALYDALGNPPEIKALKEALENCKFESMRDVLNADVFRKYLAR
jgi:hypothetical protein